KISQDTGERVGHVVIMGSGEPLDNYDNLLDFIKITGEGIGIGQRHITVSTCGLADKINELAKLKLQITLAISLHAPNDDIRKQTMPIANKYGIDELIAAARAYADTTKRRVTFEYALIKGLNDSVENAAELAGRLKGGLFHVNLIPVNDVKENNYLRSDEHTIKAFAQTLSSKGIETTVRRRLGSDINAACGQLRKRYKEKKVSENDSSRKN
ncbi:MAG: radical SAM protein, partial [Firmicutes bacterium]|nr:radical SAM protein [Bacillota bacterium]